MRLGEYPYTYVRVAAMKSLLYKQADYDRIMKMKSDEITAFLQESNYTKEINELASALSGFDLLEHALTLNSVRSLEKLKRISAPELVYLINLYLKRNDYYNIKTILRAKFAGFIFEDIEKLLITSGEMGRQQLKELMALENTEAIMKSLKIKPGLIKSGIDYFNEHRSLTLIENLLDRIYFKSVLVAIEEIPEEGQLYREFLQYEIDVLNVKLLLKLKMQNVTNIIIQEHLIYGGRILSKSRLNYLLTLDFEHMLEELKNTQLKKVIADYVQLVVTEKSLISFEIELDKFLLRKASQLIHKHPLTVDIILGYMFAKEIEVRNLKLVIKGKQLGINDEIIAKQVVV